MKSRDVNQENEHFSVFVMCLFKIFLSVNYLLSKNKTQKIGEI